MSFGGTSVCVCHFIFKRDGEWIRNTGYAFVTLKNVFFHFPLHESISGVTYSMEKSFNEDADRAENGS